MKATAIVITTVEEERDAEKLASLLIEKRLVACAQISSPIRSVYRWEGKIESAKEFVLTVKTTKEMAAEVEKVIEENHPYDVPEILTQHIDNTSKEYLQWLYEEIR